MGGLFGGGSDAADQSNDLLQKQLKDEEIEYKNKIKGFGEQELNVLDSTGGLNWNSGVSFQPATPKSNS